MTTPTAVLDALAEQHWALWPAFLPLVEVAALQTELVARAARGELLQAGVGQGDRQQLHTAIRRDRTHWLDGSTQAQQQFLQRLESLRQSINRHWFLGLFDIEAHFAHYPPGGFYRRHRDAFRDNDVRKLSAVCYLNPDWQPGDGGELRLWAGLEADAPVHVLPPLAGSLICFFSDRIPHEVLPTRTDRYSIAAWLRRNTSSSARADPLW